MLLVWQSPSNASELTLAGEINELPFPLAPGAHPLDARLHERLAAGRCAAVMVARLQRHVRCAATRGLAWSVGDSVGGG
jgi:hypothetical protein